jgi:hypothetical protein
MRILRRFVTRRRRASGHGGGGAQAENSEDAEQNEKGLERAHAPI